MVTITQKSISEVVHIAKTVRFNELVGLAIVDQADNTLLFQVQFPVNNSRIRHIVFKNTSYLISNWTLDKFPNVIYIRCDDFDTGYKRVIADDYTDRLAALELSQHTAVLDESGVRTYELKYELRDSVVWEVPAGLEILKFRLTTDDSMTSEELPLPTPFLVNFELRRE